MRRLLALVLLATPALAQSPPRVLPARDVSVTYRLEGAASESVPGGVPGSLRIEWSAGQQRLRVQPEGRPQILLVDLAGSKVEVLDSGLRTAMSLPVRPGDLQPLRLEGAHFVRQGRQTVAGLSCTDYAVQSARGHGTVCLTDDGVALRAAGEVKGRQGSFTATSVSYGAVPGQAFEIPRGYFQLAIPGMSRPQ